jgi:hypothetical protein
MKTAIALGVASLVLVACQPLYGSRPERLYNLKPVAAVPTDEPVARPVYVEACTVDFQRKPVKRTTRHPAGLVATADDAIAAADATADATKRIDLVREGIEDYSRALSQDPYDADATLKLALAYDRVYRKGCALALLRRLLALKAHPAFTPAATQDIDRVDDNPHWFRDYRAEALKAVH